MGKYVFDADSPVLNAVFLKDAPGPMVSPEIAIAQDSKRAARSLNEIKNIQLASLHGQRLSLDAQRDTAAGVRLPAEVLRSVRTKFRSSRSSPRQ